MKPKNIELIAYSTDASMIEGEAISVIYPKSAEEISRLILFGNNFVVRGGGSGLVGGAVPLNSVVLDLSKMNKILSFDDKKETIEVEAGIILDELNDYLDKYNLEFPVQPSSHAICTIGGMIATNAVGNRGVKYGRTSNWVEEVELVNGKGEVLKINKADLSDISGMEGLTGIIFKAKLKLVEKKERTASILSMDTIEEVIDKVRKLKLIKEISEIEFLDKLTSSLLELENKYHLIVEFESDIGNLKKDKYQEIMNLRDRVYPVLASLGYVHIEDPKILLHKIKELSEFLEDYKIPFFGHLGVDIVHPVFMRNQEEIVKKMLNYVRKLHGQISGEHGIGLSKKQFLDNTEKKIIMRIKRRYDPLCKINCGKVIDYDKAEEVEMSERGKERVEEAEKIIEQQNKEAEESKVEAEGR